MNNDKVFKLIKEKQYSEAESLIINATDKDKFIFLGFLYENQMNVNLSIDNYINSIKGAPSNFDRIKNLSLLLVKKGLKIEAISLLNYININYNFGEVATNVDRQVLADLIQSIKSNYKSIGIHQPNFLPYLGYFHKIFMSDVFIFHDNVEYSKRSMTRRTFIRKSLNDKTYLTIPLKKSSDKTIIKDLIIDNSLNWQEKFLNTIKNTYRKTPYFKDYFLVIQELLNQSKNYNSFSEYSIFLTKEILEILGIKREILVSSQIPVHGYKSKYNINLIKYCEGNIYNSGIGARKYQSEDEFKENDIILNYLDLYNYMEENIKEYPDNFVNGISIIDYLFNYGSEFILELFNDYSNVLNLKRHL